MMVFTRTTSKEHNVDDVQFCDSQQPRISVRAAILLKDKSLFTRDDTNKATSCHCYVQENQYEVLQSSFKQKSSEMYGIEY